MDGVDRNHSAFSQTGKGETTTSPLGAKVIARSSSAGGFSASDPTHWLPGIWPACDAMLRESRRTLTAPACRTSIARCAEAPKPNNPTLSPGLDAGYAKAAEPDDARTQRGAACRSSSAVGQRENKVGAGDGKLRIPPFTL